MDNLNILLSKKNCIKIFDSYNSQEEINLYFLKLCKIKNINYNIIKNCIIINKNLNYKKGYYYIFKNFVELEKENAKKLNNSNQILLCTGNNSVHETKSYGESEGVEIQEIHESDSGRVKESIVTLPDPINNIKNIIELIKLFIRYIDTNDIIELNTEINKKTQLYSNNKTIYSSLKGLSIYCNKYSEQKIDSILNAINCTTNIKRILFYVNKLSSSIDRNLDSGDTSQPGAGDVSRTSLDWNPEMKVVGFRKSPLDTKNIVGFDSEKTNVMKESKNIIKTVESILYNKDINKNNIVSLLKLINKCKKIRVVTDNDLEKILIKTDNNLYNYAYFLNNSNDLLVDKDNIISFINKLGYEKKSFKYIDNLNLKRGFIQGLVKDNKDYLLKYQPNKSVMELILNCYLKGLDSGDSGDTSSNQNFLIPKLFFINSDNSYFYIIEKYNTDLYKYFNILDEKCKVLTFNDILSISSFVINSIITLHKNNIIHSDIKLENIVLNIDKNNTEFNDLKIIDFDVGLFNTIPQSLTSILNSIKIGNETNPLKEKYERILNNKKPRGTRIYMLKEDTMSFKNDIYSLGVVSLILLYKNIKLLLIIKKKFLIEKEDSSTPKIKKIIIKYQSLIKKLTNLRDVIEDDSNKIKMLKLIEDYLKKYQPCGDGLEFYDENNIKKFKYYKEFIIDCLKVKLNINELFDKYRNILF